MAEIDSYDDVIGGGDSDGLADLDGKDADNSIEDVLATHPTLSPIQGGDVSEAPAAQSGTRGNGTGADTGTAGELGTTRPGGSSITP